MELGGAALGSSSPGLRILLNMEPHPRGHIRVRPIYTGDIFVNLHSKARQLSTPLRTVDALPFSVQVDSDANTSQYRS
ncbi:phospholipid-translocating atpase [Moniliophthora roreri]|nr:phospholipid-translocating atpase [Moniliophthora roreri]